MVSEFIPGEPCKISVCLCFLTVLKRTSKRFCTGVFCTPILRGKGLRSLFLPRRIPQDWLQCLNWLFFRWEDAVPDFEAALQLDSELASAHVNIGLIYIIKYSNYHKYVNKLII